MEKDIEEEVKKDKSINTDYYEESKSALGFFCALFGGLLGLFIGLCSFRRDTYERYTFVKAWGITMITCFAIALIIFFIWLMSFMSAITSPIKW